MSLKDKEKVITCVEGFDYICNGYIKSDVFEAVEELKKKDAEVIKDFVKEFPEWSVMLNNLEIALAINKDKVFGKKDKED